jgi:hypothetical protein
MPRPKVVFPLFILAVCVVSNMKTLFQMTQTSKILYLLEILQKLAVFSFCGNVPLVRLNISYNISELIIILVG